MGLNDILGIAGAATGGIGAIGSLLGGIFSNKSNKSANEEAMRIQQEQFNRSLAWSQEQFYKQLAFNEQMFERQQGANYRMWFTNSRENERIWNRNNEYNSPTAQMQRYRAAGLNPYMMMAGAGNAGNGVGYTNSAPYSSGAAAGSTPIPNGNPPSRVPMNAVWNGDLTRTLLDGLVSVQSALSDVAIKKEQQRGMAIDNEFKAQRYEVEIENMRQNAGWHKSMSKGQDIQNTLKGSTLDSDIARSKWESLQAKEQYAYLIALRSRTSNEAALIEKKLGVFDAQVSAQLRLQISQAMLNAAQTHKTYKEAKEVVVRTEFLKKDPRLSKRADEYIDAVVGEQVYNAMIRGEEQLNMYLYGSKEAPNTYDVGEVQLSIPGFVKARTPYMKRYNPRGK